MNHPTQVVMRSLMEADDGQWPQETVCRLDVGDRAWNPGSTKHEIVGPAVVEYRRYQDGGIDARVIQE